MINMSPCLTRARASSSGHWVSTRGRRMTRNEMLRLFAIRPLRLDFRDVPKRSVGAMIGNAMAVNVLERLLCRVLLASQIVLPGSLSDRWGTDVAQRAAAATLLYAAPPRVLGGAA